MSNSPEPANTSQRLALIASLWRDLQTAHWKTDEYKALMHRIRRETESFRRALAADDPTEVVVPIELP